MADQPGWFGSTSQLMQFLRVVGADCDEDGKFLIAGEQVVVGIGGDEVVVPPATVYFVDGKPHGLASGLRGTSYGMSVVVI